MRQFSDIKLVYGCIFACLFHQNIYTQLKEQLKSSDEKKVYLYIEPQMLTPHIWMLLCTEIGSRSKGERV